MSKAAGKTIEYVPLDEDDDRRRMNLLLEIKKVIKFQGTEILKLAKVNFFFFDSGNRVCMTDDSVHHDSHGRT